MRKTELYEEIYKRVDEALENVINDGKESIFLMRKDLAEEIIVVKKYILRMNEIESMIHAHAVGVQNVYSKLEKIEKTLELKDIKQLIRYIESYDSQRIKKEIEEIHKYMNSDQIHKAIDEFRDFKYNLLDILRIKLRSEENI